MRVKCLAQHKSPDKARTRTARSADDSTNHEASPPPHLRWCRRRDFASAFVFAAIGVRRERRTSLRVIFPQENKGSAAKNIPAAHVVARSRPLVPPLLLQTRVWKPDILI